MSGERDDRTAERATDLPLLERKARCHEAISDALTEYGLDLCIGHTESGAPVAILEDASDAQLLN